MQSYVSKLFLVLVILFPVKESFGQIDTKVNTRNYRSWITLNSRNAIIEGVLQQINDSSIQILRIDHFPWQNSKDEHATISTRSIEIKIKLTINGNQDNFNYYKQELTSYSKHIQ